MQLRYLLQEPLEIGWRGENITIANNVFADPGYGDSLHIGKDAVWIDEQTGEETDIKVKTFDSINGLNIENLVNKSKGDIAYTIMDFIGGVPEKLAQEIRAIDGVIRVRVIG